MTVDYRVGDVRERMAEIPDGSISLVCSSPPFLSLRSYLPSNHSSKGDEIGSEPNPAAFLDTLLALTAEWGRVLAPWGSIAIELGDTFAGSGGAGGDYAPGGLRENAPNFSGSAKYARNGRTAPGGQPYADTFKGGGPGGTGWPAAKSLALIPQLYAVALAYGINPLTGAPSPAGRWLVRNVIVWHRPNPAVGALGDKFRPSTSYITVATRSPKRWFDLDAVRTPYLHADRIGKTANNGRGDTYADEAVKSAWSNTANFTRTDKGGAPPLDTWTDHHDTWTITTQPSRLAHYAMWPPRLAERLILSMCPEQVCSVCQEPRRRVTGPAEYVPSATYRGGALLKDGVRAAEGVNHWLSDDGKASLVRSSPTLGWTDCGCGVRSPSGCRVHNDPPGENPGGRCVPNGNYVPGVVLDPFAGTGTTLAVAHLHGRDAIGIDLDPRNADLYPARLDECRRALYGTPPEMAGQLGLWETA